MRVGSRRNCASAEASAVERVCIIEWCRPVSSEICRIRKLVESRRLVRVYFKGRVGRMRIYRESGEGRESGCLFAELPSLDYLRLISMSLNCVPR